MRDSMKYWAVVGVTSTILLVAYLCPLLLISEGTDVVPEEQRQLGLEALAGAGHHFSNPIERLWITRFRLLSFDESLETFVVRAHTVFPTPMWRSGRAGPVPTRELCGRDSGGFAGGPVIEA